MTQSPRRASFLGALAFAAGVPIGLAVLKFMQNSPSGDLERYASHPVEQVEVILFCCAIAALGAKLLAFLRERWALAMQAIPEWNGQPVAASEAKALLDDLGQKPGRLQHSRLGRRVAAVLDFVQSRGTANELDDQLRCFADNDAIAQDASFSLLRLVIWAIPILGFLGTVIGITAAIAGVTPETLEQSLSGVTQGLSTAFDTTALALFLTMILMFITFLAERAEQSILAGVDAFVDRELAHRFERTGPEGGPIVEALRQNSQVMAKMAEQLVHKQSELWAQSLEKMERRFAEAAPAQLKQMQHALGQGFEAALERHAERLRGMEEKFLTRTQALLVELTMTAERLQQQTTTLGQLQQNEAQLVRLQETLDQNLAAVANAASFDQAVQSLTAAIHLLTGRVSGPTAAARKPAA